MQPSPKPNHRLCFLVLFLTLHHSDSALVTTRDRLYYDIFKDYNKYGLSTLDHRTAAGIGIECYIVSINKFDEISGELALTLYFRIHWTEERISWNVSHYDDVESLIVSPLDIWKPSLFIIQSSDRIQEIGNMSVFLRLLSDGEVFWTPADEFKISCSVDVTYFPFDKQMCKIEFMGIVYTNSELVLISENDTLHKRFLTNNSQWEILASQVMNCTEEKGPSCIEIFLNMKRKSEFYVVYILIPLHFLGIINNLVFIMPANCGERNSVAITTFLSFVVYMSIINDSVPQSSSPVSYLYFYLMFLMVYSSSIMFLCIVSLRIYNIEGNVPCLVKGIVILFRCRCLRYIARKRVRNVTKILPKGTLIRFPNGSNGVHAVESNLSDRNACTEEVQMAAYDDGHAKPEMKNESRARSNEITWFHVGRTFDIFWFMILYLTYFMGSGCMFIVLYYNILLE